MTKRRNNKFIRAVKQANRRAEKKGDTNRIELEQVLCLWDFTIFCAICGRFVEEAHASLDHVIPLANGGLNEIDNILIVHYWCNNFKKDKDLSDARDEFLKPYPLEITGDVMRDSGVADLLRRYVSNPTKRSELPEDIGELPYSEQVNLAEPDLVNRIKEQHEIIRKYQVGPYAKNKQQNA